MRKSRYAVLKQIIDLYEEFELQEDNPDLMLFGRWLSRRFEKEPETDLRFSKDKTSGRPENGLPVLNNMDEKGRFLESISRISRFHEFYSRKALKDLVINTRLEYLFLQLIDSMGQARKTDLINAFSLEYTTGMDTIRRLTGSGLLHEITDESDKRARLLVLTDKGKEILATAGKRMTEESKMFLTAISNNKWKKSLPVLEEIDQFHSSVYQSYSDRSFAELNNLMDSLKYLYT